MPRKLIEQSIAMNPISPRFAEDLKYGKRRLADEIGGAILDFMEENAITKAIIFREGFSGQMTIESHPLLQVLKLRVWVEWEWEATYGETTQP